MSGDANNELWMFMTIGLAIWALIYFAGGEDD